MTTKLAALVLLNYTRSNGLMHPQPGSDYEEESTNIFQERSPGEVPMAMESRNNANLRARREYVPHGSESWSGPPSDDPDPARDQ